MPWLDPNRNYTFSDIGKLKAPTDEVLAEYGYTLDRTHLHLPRFGGDLPRLSETHRRIDDVLPYIDLTSETARREILIAPVVVDLVYYTRSQLRIEYTLRISNWLQGDLDYLLRTLGYVIVIEAKQEDLTRGFTQLAVELIALNQWERAPTSDIQPQLIGAVSTGTIWQFGILNRINQQVTQDLALYRVPEDLEAVQRILVQALITG